MNTGEPVIFNREQLWLSSTFNSAQRLYCNNRPLQNVVPGAGVSDARIFVCEFYLGIEQTLDYLVDTAEKQGRMTHRRCTGKRHALGPKFRSLPTKDQEILKKRYRSFWSLYSKHPTVHPTPRTYGTVTEEVQDAMDQYYATVRVQYDEVMGRFETLEKLLDEIGEGYSAWRYFIQRQPNEADIMATPPVTRMHLDLMLELWRGAVWLSGNRTLDGPKHIGHHSQPMEEFLSGYIFDPVYRTAEHLNEDPENGVSFQELIGWFRRRPSGGLWYPEFLLAGLDLFNAHAGYSDSLERIPSPLRTLLLKTADQILTGQSPVSRDVLRRSDVDLFHLRIQSTGLTWDPEKGEFRSLTGLLDQPR